MESENETRPLLPSIDNESWRSRTRRRCLRIPSEITITGIILGLFLIVVTLLIVLENVESEKKEELTLDDNLLASPFKYNKKVEDQSWQGDKKADKSWQDAKEMKLKNKEQKWDKVNKGFKVSPILSASPFKYNKKIEDQSWQDDKKADKSWQDAKEMKLKNKEQKWDKVNKGFKVSPILSASPLTSDKNVEDPSWQPKSWQEWKQMKLKNRLLKWEKFNNGFKTFPILSASPFTYDKNVEDPSWEPKSWQEWKQMKLKNKLLKWEKFNKGFKTFPILSGETANLVDEENDTVKNLGISAFEDYGKEIDDDDSLETHVELQMSDPSDFRKFKEDVLEIQNMLHSNTKWSLIDEGWKTLSDQGWKEWEIRRALSKALKEKRRQLNSEYNVLQSPTNFGQIWDNIIEHWKKNKDEGKEIADNQKMIGDKEAEHQKNINDDLINEMNILQSPKSDIKNYLKDDAGWQKLTEQGWKNKAIVESLINAWKEQQNASLLQSPMNIESLFGKATDFFKSIFEKGTGEQNSQMAINDEWAKKFNNLQSPMFSSKKFGKTNEEKKKHSKDDWKDKITKTIANETDQILQSSMNFEDLTLERIIEAIKEHKKDNEEAENQIDINEDTKNDPKISYSSTQFDNKWKQVDDHWKQFIEYGLKDKNIKEAIDKAWKDSNKLLQSSVGINNYKWKKVDNGWKTISNKS